jgi:hypothetical protein
MNNSTFLRQNQQETRMRSSAISITSKTKERMSKDIGHLGFIEDESKKEKFTQYIQSKFCNDMKTDSNSVSDFVEFTVPNLKGSGKLAMPNSVKISENSRIVDLDVPILPIIKKPSKIDFKLLMNQFDEKNIDEFEIQDLLNFDFEQIGVTKEKLNELIDKTSILVNTTVDKPEENQRRSQILVFLCNKLNVSNLS